MKLLIDVPEGEYCAEAREYDCPFLSDDWDFCYIFKEHLRGTLIKKCPACLKAIAETEKILNPNKEFNDFVSDAQEEVLSDKDCNVLRDAITNPDNFEGGGK
jgi:hypothetical protein